jgi:hypothetical protein
MSKDEDDRSAATLTDDEPRAPQKDELDTEVALYERSTDLVSQLQNLEHAVTIVKRRGELLDTAYNVALGRTRPGDWVVSKDAAGMERATLCASGAHAIAPIYGIRIQDVRPQNAKGEFEPRVEKSPNGALMYTAWCDAYSGMTGGHLEAVEATRRSDEDFTGRATDDKGNIVRRGGVTAHVPDLRSAVWTLLFTKAVRVLAGMSKVPPVHLARAWEGTEKKVEDIPKGHGYGSSSERKAEDVTPEALDAMKADLRTRLLSYTGGDEGEAREVLMKISAGKNFAGFQSVARMTKDWQVKNALAALTLLEKEQEAPLDDKKK